LLDASAIYTKHFRNASEFGYHDGMLGKTYDAEVCSIARALEVVGERWTLLILRDAIFAQTTRYTEFQRRLGLATNVLSDRLDGLVAQGLMIRRDRVGDQGGVEYELTKKGYELTTALVALTDWGDRYAAPDGPPILYHHSACGATVRAALVCSGCGRHAEPGEVKATPGPGMPPQRLAYLRSTRRRDRQARLQAKNAQGN
jgi:DNA-binding HxlR family transcriptional regulator